MRVKRSILFVAVSLLPFPAAAGQTVLFDDGRTLEVARVERREAMAFIELDGGGRLAVDPERIANWDELARQTNRVTELPAVQPAVRRHQAADADDYHPSRNAVDLWRRAAGKWADLLASAASRHELDPALLTAVAHVESRFDPGAVSPKGAQGLLQLMPETARRFGVTDTFDVAQNIDGGARYLSWLLQRFEGSTELALAGYNAGENAVERYNGVPPFAETRTYVARVMNQFNRFNQGTTAR